jgi:NFU1 iron-sulfur cluster scaffold homolog, mitochondrial
MKKIATVRTLFKKLSNTLAFQVTSHHRFSFKNSFNTLSSKPDKTNMFNYIIKKHLFVKALSTPNPHFLKFDPGKEVLTTGSTYDMSDKTKALVSPLASKLFEIKGITRVTFGPDFISVGKEELTDWADIKPMIIDQIVKHFTKNESLFNEDVDDDSEDTKILDTDSDAVKLIKEIISTRIRPNLQDDGGDIKYVRFEEDSGIVYLKLKGACSNCQQSEATFKNGIEKMLLHFVAEVKGVEETDDDE